MNGFWVIMKGSQGHELDRRWAPQPENIAAAITHLVNSVAPEFHDGDTFTVEEGWSETV